MRRPFKAGKWELVLDENDCWRLKHETTTALVFTDEDGLRYLARLFAKALKYRHTAKKRGRAG